MAQQHLDRLTPVDASFLHQEGRELAHARRRADDLRGPAAGDGGVPRTHPHAPAPRAALPPQARATRPLDSGRPVWIDDPSFNLEYHVRHTALPAPGDREQLRALTARIFSQQLDRSKPLWEMWLVEGLEDDRFALISKTHHSLIDGIAGRRPRDGAVRPQPRPAADQALGRAVAARTASRARPELLAAGVTGAVRAGARAGGGRAGRAARTPSARSARAREAAEGIGEIVWAGLNPAPETPLNVDDRPAPALRRRAAAARRLQARQERVRRHRQRRRAGGRRGRAARVPDRSRGVRTEGARAARARAGVGPHRGRARHSSATASW